MKKTADIQKKIIRTILAAAAVLSCTVLPQSPAHQPQADAVQAAADPYAKKASITEEITSKRTKFTKEFVMSDGSFTAAAYSMPVHYKKSKNGGRKEINTALVKSGKKKYRTRATDLGIRVSNKANKKSCGRFMYFSYGPYGLCCINYPSHIRCTNAFIKFLFPRFARQSN